MSRPVDLIDLPTDVHSSFLRGPAKAPPLTESSEDDARIRNVVDASLVAGAIPISLAGDHSVTYPILQAIAAHHGPVEILHVDAHPDRHDELDGDRRSHASPFARIMEEGLCARLVQVAMRDVGRVDLAFERPLYISVDLDGFDPAHAAGVSHHEPGGPTPRDVVDLLLGLEAPLIGADVVEYNPDRDINGVTAVLAAKLVKELAALASL